MSKPKRIQRKRTKGWTVVPKHDTEKYESWIKNYAELWNCTEDQAREIIGNVMVAAPA